jgi:hypothetical protein
MAKNTGLNKVLQKNIRKDADRLNYPADAHRDKKAES